MVNKNVNYARRGWIGLLVSLLTFFLLIVIGQLLSATELLKTISLIAVLILIAEFLFSLVNFTQASIQKKSYIFLVILDSIFVLISLWALLALRNY